MTSFPHTSKVLSPRQLSTTPAESFAQKFQHLRISAKKAINNDRSILEGLNIKYRIGNMRLMWLCTCASNHLEKPLLQSFSTEGCPINCGPELSTEQIEAAILHGPHMSANSIDTRTSLRSEAHTKVQNILKKPQSIKQPRTEFRPHSKSPLQPEFHTRAASIMLFLIALSASA